MLVIRIWLEQMFVKTLESSNFRANKSGRSVAVADICPTG